MLNTDPKSNYTDKNENTLQLIREPWDITYNQFFPLKIFGFGFKGEYWIKPLIQRSIKLFNRIEKYFQRYSTICVNDVGFKVLLDAPKLIFTHDELKPLLKECLYELQKEIPPYTVIHETPSYITLRQTHSLLTGILKEKELESMADKLNPIIRTLLKEGLILDLLRNKLKNLNIQSPVIKAKIADISFIIFQYNNHYSYVSKIKIATLLRDSSSFCITKDVSDPIIFKIKKFLVKDYFENEDSFIRNLGYITDHLVTNNSTLTNNVTYKAEISNETLMQEFLVRVLKLFLADGEWGLISLKENVIKYLSGNLKILSENNVNDLYSDICNYEKKQELIDKIVSKTSEQASKNGNEEYNQKNLKAFKIKLSGILERLPIESVSEIYSDTCKYEDQALQKDLDTSE